MACLLVCAWSAGSVAGPHQDEPEEPAAPETKVVPVEYTVQHDDAKEDGPLGKEHEFECEHAEGKTHKVSCTVVEPQTYIAPGCLFSWPSDARLTVTKAETWTLLTLVYPEGGAIQVEIREKPAQDANSALSKAVQDWTTSYKTAGLKSARNKKVKRALAVDRICVAVTGKFIGPAQLCEIFVLKAGERQIICTLEWDSELKEVPPAFDAFCASFNLLE
jgi:hypothetical protein